jgi:glutamyl endopeptidase
MAAPGHNPVNNFNGQNESFVSPQPKVQVTNRKTLPYYNPPQARQPTTMNESFVEGFAGADANEVLPDVALASFGSASMLEIVLGNDDRVRVNGDSIATNPWRQICSLRIRSQSGRTYVGTAWFIGTKTLATAGHCVFLQDDGGWPRSIEVIPARFGPDGPFGSLNATRFSSVDGWTVQRLRDFDYGVIHLDSGEVGEQLGNFEVASFPDGILNAVTAKISGYPADRDQAQFQYFHERPIQSVTPTRLAYDIDTFGGQSGSPIWQDTVENGLVAIGIHTTGAISGNSGTRINDHVITNLISWLEV